MRKVLWCDCETGGLWASKNPMLTLAVLVEIDGEVVEEAEFHLRPFDQDIVEPKALEVNGLVLADVMAYPPATESFAVLMKLLNSHVDRYNKEDKFLLAGHNVRFDMEFLQALFKKCGDKWFGSYFDYHVVDTQAAAQILAFAGRISVPNFKLGTLCQHFGIDTTGAHTAMADIKATRELMQRMLGLIQLAPVLKGAV